MEFVCIEDYNTYCGILDGMQGSWDEFCDKSNEKPAMPLKTFVIGYDAYLFGYLLGLEIVGRT